MAEAVEYYRSKFSLPPKTITTRGLHWDQAFEAAERNDFEAVKSYVDRKRSILKYTNSEEKSLALIAAMNNNFPMLKYLLEKDDFLLYAGDMFGNNIIQRSIEHGALDTVKYLVERHNWSPERINNRYSGNTPIHHAAEEGQLEILKYLIEEKHGDVNIRNDIGESPLFNAAETPHMHIIKYLLEERGADATAVNEANRNVLYVSAIKGDLIVPKYLLDERKIPFDIDSRDKENITVVYMAVRYNRLPLVEYLTREKRANVNIADDTQRSPLHCAAFRNNLPICKLLVEHNANVHAIDKFGNTPLEDAIAEAEQDLVDYLKSIGQNRRSRRSLAHSARVDFGQFSGSSLGMEGMSRSRGLLRGNDRSSADRPAPTDGNEFGRFLTIASAFVRLASRSVYRHANLEFLLSPREMMRNRIDPVAVDAVNSVPL